MKYSLLFAQLGRKNVQQNVSDYQNGKMWYRNGMNMDEKTRFQINIQFDEFPAYLNFISEE